MIRHLAALFEIFLNNVRPTPWAYFVFLVCYLSVAQMRPMGFTSSSFYIYTRYTLSLPFSPSIHL
ncbi:hypothetical protein FIBSPDRAFT_497314 [Athelia psychrophila]|uniref:Uncharacterized protein n=1 Tax=Athelia psychrophila TaxID=1759441 RepID=A0A166KDL5_9AGAM|nr:hypothetical protein FIBSPDRAFT_497314 [Fibularhizoctonia sp. CBS 109695]